MNKYVQICNMLIHLYPKILKELNLPADYCTFIISKPLDIINDYYLYCKKDELDDAILNICDRLDNAESAVMFSCCDKTDKGYVRRIFCPEVSILRLLIGCSDIEINTFKAYYTQVFKHELGHFLYKDYLYESKGYDKGYKYELKLNEKCQKAYGKYIKELDSQNLSTLRYIRLATNYYANLEIEAKANEYGKVDIKSFIKLQIQLMSKF